VQRTPIYFEDLTDGQSFATGTVTLTEAMIIEFAERYDPQPFHTDPVAAERTFFHGLAASGWHTAALTMRLLVAEGPPFAGGLIGAGIEELRWPRPTRPGDTLRLVSEITAMRPSESRPEQGWVKLRTTTFNQNDEKVQILVSNMIVPRRPAGAA
jgi:acyl dehydratase